MSELPSISIIMPALNQSRFIEEAIRSVINQMYPKLEFLIIDGGSVDGTLDIIRKYADRVHYTSEPDFGLNHAVNKGLLEATGDFIGWLNADDTYELGALHTVGRYLRERPEVDVLYGEGGKIDENGRLIGFHAEPYDRARLFYHRDFIPTQSCFFRRVCLARVGLLDTALRWNGDWDLWRRFAKHYKIHHIDAHLGNWRVYQGTLSYGPNVDHLAKSLETIGSARAHSGRLITPIELRIWPWILIDLFSLRPFLRKVRAWLLRARASGKPGCG
ncbi:MAG: glycosyltransferase family 2 protein [bacterium]|nr:glycosyltransferase family 2 protein [bacterium]